VAPEKLSLEESNVRGAGVAREEGCVKRAREEWPQGVTADGVVLEDGSDENRGLIDGRRQGGRAVTFFPLCR
jgi:hypothetical protein